MAASRHHRAAVAITTIDFSLFEMLSKARVLPPRPTLLELGEAEWSARLPVHRLSDGIEALDIDDAERDRLQQRLTDLIASPPPTLAWDLSKILYEAYLGCSRVVSVDFNGTSGALRLDLNEPLELGEQFDLVYNGGTAEHVFDVCRFFRSVHEATRPGGVMLHGVPFRGWLEHGFYNFNPGFFWDLAGANAYGVMLLAYTQQQPLKIVGLKSREDIVRMARDDELAPNAMLYAVLKKAETESAFRVPVQGFYGGVLSDEMIDAWKTLR